MHTLKYFTLFFLCFNLNFIKENYSLLQWQSVECRSLDNEFAQFTYCGLSKNKSENTNVFSMHLRLLQLPVTNCKIQILISSDSLVVPFQFNTTWDACAFMKNRNRVRALNMLYNVISSYTNLNHSCPYDHDIIVKDLGKANTNLFIPISKGLLNFSTIWIVDAKVRLTVSGVALYVSDVQRKKFSITKK